MAATIWAAIWLASGKDARVARPAGRASSVRADGRAVTFLATGPGDVGVTAPGNEDLLRDG
jgi:hypothetical protein